MCGVFVPSKNGVAANIQGLFLSFGQILLYATADGGRTDTVRESTLLNNNSNNNNNNINSNNNSKNRRSENHLPYRGIEPASVLRLAYWSDTVPSEIFRPRCLWVLF